MPKLNLKPFNLESLARNPSKEKRRKEKRTGATKEEVRITFARFPSDFSAYEVIEKYEKNFWGQTVQYAIARERSGYMYFINEPELSPEDAAVYERLVEDVLFAGKLEREEDYVSVGQALLDEYGVTGHRKDVIVYYLMRRLYYGPITPAALDNDNLEDVIVNSFEPLATPFDPREVYGVSSTDLYPVRVVHRRYGNIRTNIVLTKEETEKIIVDTVSRVGKSITARNPLMDVMTPHGRFAAIYGGEVSSGHVISFRLVSPRPLAVTDLIKMKSISPLIVAYLWLLQDYKKPYIIMGGIGAGKTTFSRAMLQLIPPASRVIIIEDTPELSVPHDNWTHLFVRRATVVEAMESEISYDRLLKEALRHKSDYVFVGEIRGPEDTGAWLNALAVGTGGITTLHASSVLSRLRAMKVDPHLLGLVKAGVFIVALGKIGRIVMKVTEIWGEETQEGIPQWHETTLFTYSGGMWQPASVEDLVRASKNLAEIQSVFSVDVEKELKARLLFLEKHRDADYWTLFKALREEWWSR